jgi:HlyD family secretion protein
LVFVVEGGKTVSTRDVTTGVQDNQYIEIRSGLKAGETVVTAPYGAITRILKNGGKVQVVKKERLFDNTSD